MNSDLIGAESIKDNTRFNRANPTQHPRATFEDRVIGENSPGVLLTDPLGRHKPHMEFYSVVSNITDRLRPLTKQT